MKANRTLRLAALVSTVAALLLAGLISVLTAASASARGNTGQALVLRSLLNKGQAKAFLQNADLSAPATHFGPNGRYIYSHNDLLPQPSASPAASGVTITRRAEQTGVGTAVNIDEAVQTFDTFLPPPAFKPYAGGASAVSLAPTNLTPVFTADERTVLFASNRDAKGAVAADGKFHIWSISSAGDAPGQATTITQVTGGTGNEFFPALNQANNTSLAFTSDANSAGNQNLYTIPFTQGQPVTDVTSLTSPAYAKTLGSAIFSNVGRASWSPAGDRLAFTATTSSGANAGHKHIYYLFVSTNGYQSFGNGGNNPPAELTDGPADDTDPAWSPNGGLSYIAFASTASGISGTGQPISPTTSPTIMSAPAGTNRSLFIITDQGKGDYQVTSTGADDSAPAWSFSTQNQYLNPSGTFEYLAFARGASPTSAHDIYYFQVINDINTSAINKEDAVNVSVQLNTSDPGNTYDDVYPTWAPFSTLYRIAYGSNRSVTYDDPTTNAPSETAISLPQGSKHVAGFTIGVAYSGLLQSQVLNLDPSTLLRANLNSDNKVISTIDANGSNTYNIQPGQPVTFNVRLSNREAGNDDSNIYLQIKNPNSKYQDSASLEHKVFTSDQPTSPDSGSASAFLYNGGSGSGFTTIMMALYGQRGAIGTMFDKDNSLSVGHSLSGQSRHYVPYGTGLFNNDYQVFAQEYECQYIKSAFSEPLAAVSFGTPFWLAGIDDQAPFSGAGKANGRTEWLKLTKSATQDTKGGVLYNATWTTPVEPSDYYMDVIAFDKAVFPALPAGSSGFLGGQSNWRIYDNTGGFTTSTFGSGDSLANGNNDILVVSDYMLGQKFAATTFGGTTGLQNLVPSIYGAESYLTDVDVNILPNSVYFIGTPTVPPGLMGNYVENIRLGRGLSSDPFGQAITSPFNRAQNALGVGSYWDIYVQDGRYINTGIDPGNGQDYFAPYNQAQRYNLWRVQCRGPLDPAVLSSYAPTFVPQPAVADPATGIVQTASTNVPVAQRCVLWASPFTGDLFVGQGTMADPTTQNLLRAFVKGGTIGSTTFKGGGRLCVTGQDVGSTLTSNGTVNNTGAAFLPSVLSATLVSSAGGSNDLTGANAAGSRLTYDGLFNPAPPVYSMNFFEVEATGPDLYKAPGAYPLYMGNDWIVLADTSTHVRWRTDGSLDQFSAFQQSFGGGNVLKGQIDTIAPVNGAHSDVTFNDNGSGAGLIYNEDATNGSKTVFASFGLEGLGIEYYKVTIGMTDYYFPRQQRPNVLHNIVQYLRTGTFTGRITQGTGGGQGVQGATVYLIPNGGTKVPGTGARQTFSTTSGSNGAYTISGVEPGSYTVAAYKTGFSSASSQQTTNGYQVEADTTVSNIGLNLQPLAAGSISGTVTDTSKPGKPVASATVTFVSTDGQTTVSGTTDATGSYSISNVPVGTYTGTATAPGYGSASPIVAPPVLAGTNGGGPTVVVNTGQTTTPVNFALPAAPGTVNGTVTDITTGAGLVGATVTFTGVGAPVKVTTGAGGAYTASLSAGTYTATASFAKYVTSAPVTIKLAPGATVTQNFALKPAGFGQLGGLVTDAILGNPLGGATVILTDSTGAQAYTFPTTAATQTGPDGKPVNYLSGVGAVQEGSYTATVTIGSVTSAAQTVFVAANGFTRLDFTGANSPQAIAKFNKGYNFFSLPTNYTSSNLSWDVLFGTLNTGTHTAPSPGSNRSRVANWQPQLLQYVLDPQIPADSPHLGIGYWVYLVQPVGLTTAGTANTTPLVTVPLHTGWNQIGVPSTNPNGIAISSLTFLLTGNQTPLTFDQATNNQYHAVDPTLYGYQTNLTDPTQPGTYVQVIEANAAGGGSVRGTSLMPYQAYWIYAYSENTIRIPTN